MLLSTGGTLYLLPTNVNYILTSYRYANNPLTIKSYANFTAILVLSADFNMQVKGNVVFQNLKLTRKSTNSIGNLFSMDGGSSLMFDTVEISNITQDSSWSRFAQGGPCNVTFNNSNIINNDLSLLTSFIEIWTSSILTINNSFFSNITLRQQTFFMLWDPPTQVYFENSILSNMDLLRDDTAGNLASFILTNAQHQYYNVSITNFTLNKGALIRFLANNNLLKNVFNASYCVFSSLTTYYTGMVIDLIQIYMELHLTEVYFYNNTNYCDYGSIIYLYDADNTTVDLSNIIVKYNYALLIYSVYTKYINFTNISVISHNMRSPTDKASSPYSVCYIESTADLNFMNLTIDGAWSNQDVGGLKIHINSDLLYRTDIDVATRLNNGVIIYVNFTNCYFGNISSIDENWMDTGSGMAFHSNLPLKVFFINTTFWGNVDDKGATCMEVYGQNLLDLRFINGIFVENSALTGSPCLALYILSVGFQNCFFEYNSLIPRVINVNDFIEGTTGGVIYSETNVTQLFDCYFVDNAAYGGGVFYFYDVNIPMINITLINCTFMNNQAKLGGVLSLTNVYHSIYVNITNSTFINNQALNGGCFFLDYSSDNSLIMMKNNSFLNNNALKGGMAYISTEGFNVFFENNQFNSNMAWNFGYLNVLSYGGVYYISEEASASITNSLNNYNNNTSFNSGGVYSINRGVINETKSNFSYNNGWNEAGSIAIGNSATCFLTSNDFSNESTNIWGGSISLSENAYLFINNSNFQGCFAKQGGVLFIENHYNVTIIMCNFSNNTAYEGGVLLLYTSSQDLTIKNCSFYNNPAQKYLIMVTSSLGILRMANLIVKYNQCNFVGIINSNLNLSSSEFQQSNCSLSVIGCIVYAEESFVLTRNIKIEEIQPEIDGTLFYFLNCLNVSLEAVTIQKIYGLSKGGCTQAVSSNVNITSSGFFSVGYGCLYFSNSYINLTNDTFDNIDNVLDQSYALSDFSEYGSFLYLDNCYNAFVISCSFSNNQARTVNGGGIKALDSQIDSFFIINQSIFSNNEVNSMGGALYFENQAFIIISSIFFNNTAESGGALYFTQSSFNTSNTKSLFFNNFTSNEASLQGGAIYFYDNYFDMLENNFYYDNIALYGNDLASYPQYLRFKMYNNTLNNSTSSTFSLTDLNESLLLWDSFKQSIDNVTIADFPTGQPFTLILVFELLDFFDQTINIMNSGLGHIQTLNANYLDKTLDLYIQAEIDNNSTKTYDFDNQKITLSGTIDSSNKNGCFYFTDLTIYATPTSTLNFFISNDLLLDSSMQHPENFVKINNTLGLLVPVQLRACVPGELYIKDINYCSACPAGKYSLNPKDVVCLDCPANAECPGGSVVNVNSEYWRAPDEDSVSIYYCLDNPEACLGGTKNECQQEYQGPLCSVCKLNDNGVSYTKIGKYCVTCLDTSLNSVFLVGMLSAYGLVLFVMIKMNQKVNPETFITNQDDRYKSPNNSLLYKILIDHIQFLGINENIGFDVPNYFQLMNSVQSGSVYFVQQLFSFDCFIKYTSNDFNLQDSLILIRSACVALLPLFSIIMIIIFWSLYYILKKKKKKKDILTQVVASIVITLFLLQPTILNSMSRLFACMALGKENYVTADMNMLCWGSDHIFMILVFSLPCLLIWNMGFPCFCLMKILQKRKNLKDEDTVLKYGFLYNGFDQQCFYWGFVKYFQKVIIILLRMSNFDNGVKMLTILLIWIFDLIWNRFHLAYVHQMLNNLEFCSSFVNMLTLFLSQYLIIGVSNEGESAIFILILILNL